MIPIILKIVGIGLTALTAVIILLGLVAWLAWFRFPRMTTWIAEMAFHVAVFGRHLAGWGARVASAPFRAAGKRMEKLREWSRRTYMRSQARIEQLSA